MLFMGFIPVFGAIANGKFDFFHLFLLLIMGLLMHVYGFVQNDYFDITVDSKSKYVSDRPLATGRIPKRLALAIFFSSFLAILITASIFFFTVYSILMLLISFLLMTLYNKYSKRYFAMEYVLGLGVFTFGIYGALTVTDSVSFFVIIVAAVGFMQWLFSVGVSANLKDVEFDTKQGIKTTPTVFGVHVTNQKLLIPTSFWIYTFCIKAIHILLVSLMFILGFTSIFIYDFPIPGISFVITSIFLFYLTMKILSTPIIKRDSMLIFEGLQEGFSLLLMLIVLMSYITANLGIAIFFLLIILFIIWPFFWLRILYKKRMIPLE